MVCLFLWMTPLASQCQDFVFDDRLRQAYRLTLNLQADEALQIVTDQNSAEDLYIASLAEAIEVFGI